MKLESLKMNLQASVVCYLTSVFRILSSVFMQNKPNSPNVQTNVTFFILMVYTIFASLTVVKNKPNQTQFLPTPKGVEQRSDYEYPKKRVKKTYVEIFDKKK